MTIIIMVVAGVLLLVVGMSFVFKGYAAVPDPNLVVPVAQYKDLERQLNLLRQEQDNLKVELQSATQKLADSDKKIQEAVAARDASFKEKKSLEEALDEIRAKPDEALKVQGLQEELKALQQKADSQARDALLMIENLQEENRKLAEKATEAPAEDSGEIQRLLTENQGLSEQLARAQEKIQQTEELVAQSGQDSGAQLASVQEELRSYTEQAQARIQELEKELSQSRQKIDELSQGGVLKPEDNKKEAALPASDEAINGLQLTIQMLQSQLEERAIKIANLEDRRNVIEKEAGINMQRLEDHIRQSEERIAGLLAEQDAWQKDRAALEASLKKVKEFNGQLLEKDRMIQYELAKSRAQAMGFEKINEDFKTQLEQMYKTVETLKKR